MPKTYTVKEVANILGYSTNSIYTFLKEKRIKGVRVGKGRFRIPEEELSRILHITRRQAPADVVGGATPSPVALIQPTVAYREPNTQPLPLNFFHHAFLFPTMIEWFFILSAVVWAAAFVLFDALKAYPSGGALMQLSPMIAGALGVTGLGLLVSSMLANTMWRQVGKVSMLVIVALGAWFFVPSGNVAEVCVLGSLAIVGAIEMAFGGNSAQFFIRYLTMVFVLLPLAIFWYLTQPGAEALLASWNVTAISVCLIAGGISILVISGLWMDRVKHVLR